VDKEGELHTAEGSNPILLTAWVRVNADLVQEFPTFCGPRRFITVLTTAHHLPLLSRDKHNTSFEVCHLRCVGSVTKNFLCITHTVEQNYISRSSTVAIELHVSALYVCHLEVVI